MDSIAGQVARELERFGPAGDIAKVVAAWPEAVGDSIARSAWPLRLARDRTLHVATDSSAWAFELAQLGPILLERLRDTLGEATPSALRFAVGPLPSAAGADPSRAARTAPLPGPAEQARARALAGGIDDDALRALVVRAAAASLARAASDR